MLYNNNFINIIKTSENLIQDYYSCPAFKSGSNLKQLSTKLLFKNKTTRKMYPCALSITLRILLNLESNFSGSRPPPNSASIKAWLRSETKR